MTENRYFTRRISKAGNNLFVSIPKQERGKFTHRSLVKLELLEKKEKSNND